MILSPIKNANQVENYLQIAKDKLINDQMEIAIGYIEKALEFHGLDNAENNRFIIHEKKGSK